MEVGIDSREYVKNHPGQFGMDLHPHGWISIPFYKNQPDFTILQFDYHCKLMFKLATDENVNVLIYCKYNQWVQLSPRKWAVGQPKCASNQGKFFRFLAYVIIKKHNKVDVIFKKILGWKHRFNI